MKAADYWRLVCAPKLREKKRELDSDPKRKLTAAEIAASVEAQSGKATGRVLVQRWLKGEREPYASQLIALCSKMELNLVQFLQSAPIQRAEPLIRYGAGTLTGRKRLQKIKRPGTRGRPDKRM